MFCEPHNRGPRKGNLSDVCVPGQEQDKDGPHCTDQLVETVQLGKGGSEPTDQTQQESEYPIRRTVSDMIPDIVKDYTGL